MHQPFGIDFSNKDIPSVFATCVSCIKYALDGAPNADQALQLSVLRLRITRWGEAVEVYEDPEVGQLYTDLDDVEAAKDVMIRMIALFEFLSADTKNPAEDLKAGHPTGANPQVQSALTTLEAIASERSQGSNSILSSQLLGLGKWPKSLANNISRLIDELEEIFPAAQFQRDLCAPERLRFKDEGALKSLEIAAVGIDPWISASISRPNFIFDDACPV